MLTIILIAMLISAALFALVLLFSSVYIVSQAEAIIIERFGKFHKILHPGINFVIPFVDQPRTVYWTYTQDIGKNQHARFTKTMYRIDLRESVDDFPRQNVITKDNVTMQINALLYYHIFDPKAAVYEIINLPEAIEKLTQTTLRNVIGSLDLDESLVSRDQINERLRIILDDATDKWGVKVSRVELQEVLPPEDIRVAMEKQMRAERDRRAIILESEGKKRAAILEAEGVQESQILRAKGEAESRILRVQAEAQAIQSIKAVTPDTDPLPYLIALQYIKALPELAQGKEDKLIMVPYEASALTGSLASLKKMFNEI